MKQASFYTKFNNDSLQCNLCPHKCTIQLGKKGNCKVRINVKGELYTEVYGVLSAINLDPIEKKPLYHFHPGKQILSIGTIGCNLHCRFCQNCEISQQGKDEYPYLKEFVVNDIISLALNSKNNIGIAYTYNEPTVWFEYMLDIAKAASEVNLKNVMVTNGFINQEPLEQLISYMDAFNVDLKAFNPEFYKNITYSELEPVKQSLKTIVKSKRHLEITNLVIPGLNDDEIEFEDMVKWIQSELGSTIVLHLSRYFPKFKMTTEITPKETLVNFKNIADKYLKYVYLGNV